MTAAQQPAVAGCDGILGLAASEYLLVLLTRPAEIALCAGLVAEACARGRPPLVAVLTDGSGGAEGEAGAARAVAAERALRQATATLGLARDRLFLFGLHDGTAPPHGTPLHAALLRAVAFLMWSRDCNVIVAPEGVDGPDHAVAEAVAAQVAAETGVGRVTYRADGAAPAGWTLPGPGPKPEGYRAA